MLLPNYQFPSFELWTPNYDLHRAQNLFHHHHFGFPDMLEILDDEDEDDYGPFWDANIFDNNIMRLAWPSEQSDYDHGHFNSKQFEEYHQTTKDADGKLNETTIKTNTFNKDGKVYTKTEKTVVEPSGKAITQVTEERENKNGEKMKRQYILPAN